MKSCFLWLNFFISNSVFCQQPICERVIIITIDGVRWQEVYEGANKNILFNNRTTPMHHSSRNLFWDTDPKERRAALMPFLWNYIAKNGQLFGNRNVGNPMQVKNRYCFSYAGYNELFTGFADRSIIGNKPVNNKNISVLEYLNNIPKNKDSVAVFTSWNFFPFIFNKQRSKLVLNSGTTTIDHHTGPFQNTDSRKEEKIFEGSFTRNDSITYAAAKAYLLANHPKVLHIGFGEADEFAHHKNYGDYLANMHQVDQYIANLWETTLGQEAYKNKTIFIITTDHGRGAKTKNWNRHGMFVHGSNQTWMAVFGNCIKPEGEVKTKQTIYNAQVAETIANMFGEKFVQPHTYSESLLATLQ